MMKQTATLLFGIVLQLFLVAETKAQHLDETDLPGATPLECNGNLYLFQSVNANTDTNFSQVNPDGTLTTWGNAADGLPGTTTQINSIGFNVEDGLIYGYSPDRTYGNSVFAVDADGNTYNLGDPTGISGTSFAGDMDGMGNLYLTRGARLYKIDVNVFPLAATEVTLDLSGSGGNLPNGADWAIGPDNIIYGYDRNVNQVWTLDLNVSPSPTAYVAPVTAPPIGSPGTGALGTVGGFYFDSFGNLYGYQNGTTNGNPPGVYFIDTTTGVARLVATGGGVSRNDGASCAYSVGFQKTVSPAIARPGETVTYTFGVSNLDVNGSAFTGIEISDILSTTHGGQFTGVVSSGGVTWPAADLDITSANGGTDNAIDITNITIPAGGITYIDVEVLIPADAPLCSVLENSATLTDALDQIPDGSSWPPGAIGPGPTQLAIIKPPVFSKDVTPDLMNLADLPTTVTYSFVIDNPNPGILEDVDFSDTIPIGTLVAASLSSNLGGTENAYAGTQSLSISSMDLPIGVTTLTVEVLIPDEPASIGVHCNQAMLADPLFDVFDIPSTDTDDVAGSETSTCLEVTGAPLPIELVSFEGLLDGNRHHLTWTTASESASSGFSIQRAESLVGTFEDLGFVESAGSVELEHQYSWTTRAKNITGSVFYRLKMIDLDGSHEYSSVIELTTPSSLPLQLGAVYPQPANTFADLEIAARESSRVTMELYDLQGRLVSRVLDQTMEAGASQIHRIQTSGLSNGNYIYKLVARSLDGQAGSTELIGKIVILR